MSGGAKTTKSSSGTVSIGGTKVSSTLGPNGQSTKINLSPVQQGQFDATNAGITSNLAGINAAASTSPAQMKQYAADLFNPVANTINTSYNDAANRATEKFGASGGLNSVGFQRYNDDKIEKARANSLGDAQSQANIQAYSLPSLLQQPYLTALGANSETNNNIFTQAMNLAGKANSGLELSSNYNYQNGLTNGGSSSNSPLKNWLIPGYWATHGFGSLF